jgi:hypothetical protein
MNPDWRVESDYDYLDKLSLSQLAFEFLRRNPDYIQDHHEYAKIEAALAKNFGPKVANYEIWKKAGKAIGTIWDPPRLPGESRKNYFHRTMDHPNDPAAYWYEEWFQRKWGLEGGFPTPESPTKIELKFKSRWNFPILPDYREVGLFFHGDSIENSPYTQVEDKVTVVFDLESPLKAQLAEVKKILQQEAKGRAEEYNLKLVSEQQTANFRKKFKTYIRVLDGAAANSEKKVVAHELFGEEAKLKAQKDFSDADNFMLTKRYNNHKSAEQFVHYKYCTIPFYKE